MYELEKKNRKVLTSKSVGTGPSSYEKRIYRAAVSQRLRNTGLEDSIAVPYHKGSRLLHSNVRSALKSVHAVFAVREVALE